MQRAVAFLDDVAFDFRKMTSTCLVAGVLMAKKKKWVDQVKTVSTFPPQSIFTQDAETIARVMATKEVSPKGLGSGIRMIQFFINRAGKNLLASRRHELEEAKHILQAKLQAKKQKAP